MPASGKWHAAQRNTRLRRLDRVTSPRSFIHAPRHPLLGHRRGLFPPVPDLSIPEAENSATRNKRKRNEYENNETLENRFCDACCFLPRLVPLRHSPTVFTHPQGRHVFGEIIPNIHKTPEHLFRLSPRQKLFRSCYERFCGNFSNFAAK